MKRQELAARRRQLRSRQPELLNRIDRLLGEMQRGEAIDTATLQRWSVTYRKVRETSFRMNNKVLVPMLDKGAIHFAASQLGMLHRNTVVFDSEDDTGVLMDFAIYNYRVDGKNAVERHWEAHADELDFTEKKWLQGALRARYTLLLLGEAFPGVGLRARDILTGEPLFLADVNFSQSAAEGLTMATRIMPIDDFHITGGAGLPAFGQSVLSRIGEYLTRTCSGVKDYRDLSPERTLWLEAFIIRTCLADPGRQRLRYADA